MGLALLAVGGGLYLLHGAFRDHGLANERSWAFGVALAIGITCPILLVVGAYLTVFDPAVSSPPGKS